MRYGRPKVEETPTREPPQRVPRTRKTKKPTKKGFLAKHIWYCGWGVAGLTGLSMLYEKYPEVAKKILSIYILLWVTGGLIGPAVISRQKGRPPEKTAPPEYNKQD